MSLCKCENCGKRIYLDEDHECDEDDVVWYQDVEDERVDWMMNNTQ